MTRVFHIEFNFHDITYFFFLLTQGPQRKSVLKFKYIQGFSWKHLAIFKDLNMHFTYISKPKKSYQNYIITRSSSKNHIKPILSLHHLDKQVQIDPTRILRFLIAFVYNAAKIVLKFPSLPVTDRFISLNQNQKKKKKAPSCVGVCGDRERGRRHFFLSVFFFFFFASSIRAAAIATTAPPI